MLNLATTSENEASEFPAKILINLSGCAGLFVSELGAHVRR